MLHKLCLSLVIGFLWPAVFFDQTPAPMPDWSTYTTNCAVASGPASTAATWTHPPVAGDWLCVPANTTVTWDLTAANSLHFTGICVSGTLDFGQAPGNLVLDVGTFVGERGGTIMMGNFATKTPPVANTILVTLGGSFVANDPGEFSIGFLTMGANVSIYGTPKTAWTTTAACKAGDTQIFLPTTPNGWNAGDSLIVPGVFLSPVQDEVVTIEEIQSGLNGTVVFLTTKLQYDHLPVAGPQGQINTIPIGNLTRQITFQSANPGGTRAHCMFMVDRASGTPSVVNAAYLAVNNCGRTLASIPVTDPMVDATGTLIPGTADNVRARYAWHSHRQGQAANALQTWQGVVVNGGTKWGFDNHDSFVNATSLLAYNCEGACFATERGSEIGGYIDCLGIRTSGEPGDENSRGGIQDYGWQGSGMWLQGPGVIATGNVFAGHPAAGLYVFTMGPRAFTSGPGQLPIDGTGILALTFARSLLPPSYSLVNPNADPLVVQTPYFGISGNTSFGCGTGHTCTWTQTDTTVAVAPLIYSRVQSPVAWNCNRGMELAHAGNFQVDNALLIGPNCTAGSTGIECATYSNNYLFNNPSISGFEVGQNTTSRDLTVNNGYYSNVTDFVDSTPTDHQVVIQVTATFVPVAPSLLAGRTPLNIKLSPQQQWFFDQVIPQNVNSWFYPTSWLVNGLEVFRVEQAESYVPMPATSPSAPLWPPILIGLTNAQLKAQYGMCVGDKIPGAPVAGLLTNGIVSQVQPDRPCYVFGGGTGTDWKTTATEITFSAYDFRHQLLYTDPMVTALQPGVNALARTINGQSYTFFVTSAGIAPPPQATTTTTIQVTEAALRPLTCTARVVSTNGIAVNEGIITFSSPGANSVQAPVTNGTASGTILALPGTDTVTATYSGGADFQGSLGAVQVQVN